MKNQIIITAILCLIIGFGVGMGVAKKDTNMAVDHSAMTMHESMDAMTGGLQNKTGVEFDRAFLTEMITHHEGALEMAAMVKQKSTNPELLSLADAIIIAQTKEIALMKQWLSAWK